MKENLEIKWSLQKHLNITGVVTIIKISQRIKKPNGNVNYNQLKEKYESIQFHDETNYSPGTSEDIFNRNIQFLKYYMPYFEKKRDRKYLKILESFKLNNEQVIRKFIIKQTYERLALFRVFIDFLKKNPGMDKKSLRYYFSRQYLDFVKENYPKKYYEKFDSKDLNSWLFPEVSIDRLIQIARLADLIVRQNNKYTLNKTKLKSVLEQRTEIINYDEFVKIIGKEYKRKKQDSGSGLIEINYFFRFFQNEYNLNKIIFNSFFTKLKAEEGDKIQLFGGSKPNKHHILYNDEQVYRFLWRL